MAEAMRTFSLSHDRPTYDLVSQEILVAEFNGDTLPYRRYEGPISPRGDFLMNVIQRAQEIDPTVRVGQQRNGNYDQLQAERPIRIFTQLGSESLMAIEDAVLYADEEVQMKEAS